MFQRRNEGYVVREKKFVTLRGRLVNVQENRMPATMNCRITDHFSHKTEMSLIKINQDGSFC